MKLILYPETIRTFLPIHVTIYETTEKPKLVVIPSDKLLEKFLVPLEANETNYRGEFWLRQPGRYELVASTSTEKISYSLQVAEQRFINFSTEFGIFTALFLVTCCVIGGILWRKKKG